MKKLLQVSVCVLTLASVSNANAWSLFPAKKAKAVQADPDALVLVTDPVPQKIKFQVSPQSVNQTCDELAQDIADKALKAKNKWNSPFGYPTLSPELSERYQLAKVEGKCIGTMTVTANGQNRVDHTIELTSYGKYDRDTQLNLTTISLGIESKQGGGTGSSDASGAYKSYDACVADTARQQKDFEENTGLVAIYSSCRNNSGDDQRFTMDITTVGSSAVTLHSYVTNFEVYSAEANANLAARAQDIAAIGGKIVNSSHLALYYYAKQGIAKGSVADFNTQSDCEQQLGDVKKLLLAAGSNPAITNVSCSSEDIPAVGDVQAHTIYTMNTINTDNVLISSPDNNSGYRFDDYTNCDKAKSQLAPDYLGNKSMMFCSPSIAGPGAQLEVGILSVMSFSN
jgi:hypothetical protein